MMGIAGAFAQRQQREYSLLTQQQIAFSAYRRHCIANYVAYHGCEPPAMMDDRTVCREYDRPWRKTHIPKVPHADT